MIAFIGTENPLAFGKVCQGIIIGPSGQEYAVLTLSISKSQSVTTERLASISSKKRSHRASFKCGASIAIWKKKTSKNLHLHFSSSTKAF